MGLDVARVVSNLQPLVPWTCERGGDAGEGHCACQRPGCVVLRASRETRQQQLFCIRLGLADASAELPTGSGLKSRPAHRQCVVLDSNVIRCHQFPLLRKKQEIFLFRRLGVYCFCDGLGPG